MKKHFSDKDIDAINEEIKDNYFTYVLKNVFQHIGKVECICDVGCSVLSF